MEYVIGCDVGSQGTKAILLSTTGDYIGEAYEGYPIDYPHPLWAEQPVERWLNALTLAIRRLLSESEVAAQHVRALSLATQVDGVIPIELRRSGIASGHYLDGPSGKRPVRACPPGTRR